MVVAVVATVCGWFGSSPDAQSALWGGIVAIVPGGYMALCMGRNAEKAPKQFLKAFYAGELGKWLLTVLLFYGLFTSHAVTLLPLLVGYGAALMVYWLALLPRRL